ncbi:hypothetical protein A3L04_05750 [Thermococcus chitonophagus]|uniref:MIP18 family-like domain-containing protein n=1 Tax=Thermococcus chitonophagus TaxID=54262 RepID=A0A160VRN3_9EURY|nr:iron-sulfur cluster assembly protein [Thermococcus chitonophagus]ASJ16607.1 hypothetical protein A3L04_05750 [Thermococcus chitonophagus]CUX77472.1 hypothetical protein CHITON_0693 [Thermococcus chitonophagus]
MEILEKLRRVKNPFTGQDIVSEGLVTKVIKEDNKVIIYVAFARNTPRKPAAMAMVWPIQAKIVREIVNVLKDYDIEILDDLTLQRYYPVEEV